MSKKSITPKQAPAQVIRCGEVTATVQAQLSPTGYQYFDFVVHRHWTRGTTGKESSATSFFDRNEDDLVQAIRAAAAWIREQTDPVPTRAVQEPAGPPVA